MTLPASFGCVFFFFSSLQCISFFYDLRLTNLSWKKKEIYLIAMQKRFMEASDCLQGHNRAPVQQCPPCPRILEEPCLKGTLSPPVKREISLLLSVTWTMHRGKKWKLTAQNLIPLRLPAAKMTICAVYVYLRLICVCVSFASCLWKT